MWTFRSSRAGNVVTPNMCNGKASLEPKENIYSPASLTYANATMCRIKTWPVYILHKCMNSATGSRASLHQAERMGGKNAINIMQRKESNGEMKIFFFRSGECVAVPFALVINEEVFECIRTIRKRETATYYFALLKAPLFIPHFVGYFSLLLSRFTVICFTFAQ